MMQSVSDPFTLVAHTSDTALKQIGEKILNKERISFDEGVTLFEKGSLSWLGTLANWVREQKHGNKTYFNRNFHIEPTNVCVFSCKFCSYSRLYAHREEGWGWVSGRFGGVGRWARHGRGSRSVGQGLPVIPSPRRGGRHDGVRGS